MPDTVQQILGDVYASLRDIGQSRLLRLLNKVHREILAHLPEIRRDSIAISLVAGQQEYNLDELTFQTDQAIYLNAAGTQALALGNTNIEYLEKEDSTWRQRNGGTGTPWLGTGSQGVTSIDYYLDVKIVSSAPTLVIGFNYPPDTATATGTLTLHQSRLQSADLGINDSILPNLISGQIYVEGILYYAAREIRPSLASAFQATWQYQLALNQSFIRTRNEGLKKPQFLNVRATGSEFPAVAEQTENGNNSTSSGGQ